MGHNDRAVIARVYGRWIKDAVPDAGEKAGGICGFASKGRAQRKHKKNGKKLAF